MTFISNFYEYWRFIKKRFISSLLDVFDFKDFRLYLLFLISVNFLLWLGAYLIKSNLSHELVILHYNVDFGIDLIGESKQLYTIPIFGLAIIIFNILLLLFFTRLKDLRFMIHLLLATALMLNLFLLLALASLYLINFK